MNDQVPFFSIIMPCYNAERYLKDALDSVLAQTFTDWELILIDDGSKDHSLAIAQECLKDEPRAHIFSVPNGGVSKARNIGLDHAQGEWILFMDADDLILPSHLQSYAEGADCDIVFQGSVEFDCDTGEAIVTNAMEPVVARTKEEVAEVMCGMIPLSRSYNSVWGKIFRRELMNEWGIRFHEDLSYGEDQTLTTEYCGHIKSLRLLPGTSYRYRRGQSALTNRYVPPADVLKLIDYYRKAIAKLYLTPKLQHLFEESCTSHQVLSCLMLYYRFHLTLRRSTRLAYLQTCIDQAKKAPTESSQWFLQGDAKQTDRVHMKGYLRSCKQYLQEQWTKRRGH